MCGRGAFPGKKRPTPSKKGHNHNALVELPGRIGPASVPPPEFAGARLRGFVNAGSKRTLEIKCLASVALAQKFAKSLQRKRADLWIATLALPTRFGAHYA